MPRKRKGVTAAQQRERLKRQQNVSKESQLCKNQGESELLSHIDKPDTYKVIPGTLHQGDTRFQYPGIQCAYISLIALIRMSSKDPQSWTSRHIDSCIIDGNTMFMEHCETLKIQPKMLMANELPHLIKFSNKSFVCNQSENDIEVGLLKPNTGSADECVPKSINEALSERLSNSQTCLLFCGGLTIAVAKFESHLYAFDPHSRGKDGLLNPVGTAVMMVFDHLNDLVRYIERLFLHSLKIRPSEQFELVPFSISQQSIRTSENVSTASPCITGTIETTSISHAESLETKGSMQNQQGSPGLSDNKHVDPSKSIESYFEDQNKRQQLFEEGRLDKDATKLKQKNEYMKNYMKRRREKETIRKQENDSARLRMQSSRSTSEGKQKNKDRSLEGMRKLMETNAGRLKHNQLSAETMRKRLCTHDGRLKHNERSAESMRNMLKDDQKRLKHKRKSAEAMKRMLTDEQKKTET